MAPTSIGFVGGDGRQDHLLDAAEQIARRQLGRHLAHDATGLRGADVGLHLAQDHAVDLVDGAVDDTVEPAGVAQQQAQGLLVGEDGRQHLAQAGAAERDDRSTAHGRAARHRHLRAFGQHHGDAGADVVEQRDEHVALVAEILVEGAAGDARLLADVGDVGGGVAAAREHALGRVEQLGAAGIGGQVAATAN